eukprot:COSAG02_NODE_23535_length_715_cov_2.438312_1_plen_129_part_00
MSAIRNDQRRPTTPTSPPGDNGEAQQRAAPPLAIPAARPPAAPAPPLLLTATAMADHLRRVLGVGDAPAAAAAVGPGSVSPRDVASTVRGIMGGSPPSTRKDAEEGAGCAGMAAEEQRTGKSGRSPPP